MQLTNPGLFREAAYLNGRWISADSAQTISVDNPANLQVIGHIPNCGTNETRRAIEAANTALPAWRALTAKSRSDILWKLAELIDANKEDLATIMTLECGKPINESRGEIDYANSFIKWFAEEGRRVYGDVIPSNNKDQHLLVIKQPIGVCAAITPWNFPTAMITRKIAPALAVGCTIVVKPDSSTPYSALALAYLAEQAGIPAGVLNVMTGDSASIGAELTSNPLVRKVSFTGSTPVGRLLMAQSASTIKKLSLELGGNAPFIVFDDADIAAAVKGAIASKFRNAGQTCVCANRIYVQDKIYEEFAAALLDAVKALKLGNGLEESSQVGPLIKQAGLDKVERHVADALKKGAKLACGGKLSELGGLFYEPTMLTEMTQDMLIAKEETFGPVAPLFRFTSDEDVIQMANATEFGLAAYFYSNNIKRVWQVAEALEYGMVGINTGLISTEVAPFGGVKQSGIGREGSKYGLDEYLEMKYLCMG